MRPLLLHRCSDQHVQVNYQEATAHGPTSVPQTSPGVGPMLSPQTRQALLRRGKSTLKCFAVAGATGYVLFKVAALKLNEYLDAYQAEKASDDLVLAHFERIRMQVKQINASYLPELGEILGARYHIEELMSKLQAEWINELPPDQARQERLRIWNQIKLEVVSKTISAIYLTSLLALLIGAQMGIVGKYLYIKDVMDRSNMPSLPIKADLEQTAAIGKALMSICTRFVASGAETIDAAVARATALVLSRVEVHQPVSRVDLDLCVMSIRHEIEDAAGRDIIEEVLLGHDALSDAFGLLPATHRPFANKIFSDLKGTLSSSLFKHQLSNLVDRKISSIIGLACEELYASSQEPLLLSIIPNVNAEFWILMSPKMMVETEAQVTTLMASVFRSVNLQL